MVRSIRHALKFPIAVTFLACLACAGGYSTVDQSPPPYAPAYGYRYRHPHDHVMLVYHPDLAIYAVSGYSDCYYRNGQYYRLRNGTWYYGSRIRGPWESVSYQMIPSGLKQKYKAPPPGHAKEHGASSNSSHGKEQKKHIHGHKK